MAADPAWLPSIVPLLNSCWPCSLPPVPVISIAVEFPPTRIAPLLLRYEGLVTSAVPET